MEGEVRGELIRLFKDNMVAITKELHTSNTDTNISVHINFQGSVGLINGTIYRYIMIGIDINSPNLDIVICEQFAFIDRNENTTVARAVKIHADVAVGNRKRTIAQGDWDDIDIEDIEDDAVRWLDDN